MKQERVILSFIMVLIGLVVAGIVFYFYQSTKTINSPRTNLINVPTPTPTPKPKIYLNLTSPSDEEVVNNKTINITGQTNPGATITIVTSSSQQVIEPSSLGNFTTTLTLNDGQNIIKVWALNPNGDTTSLQRTVTYSTDNF